MSHPTLRAKSERGEYKDGRKTNNGNWIKVISVETFDIFHRINKNKNKRRDGSDGKAEDSGLCSISSQGKKIFSLIFG